MIPDPRDPRRCFSLYSRADFSKRTKAANGQCSENKCLRGPVVSRLGGSSNRALCAAHAKIYGWPSAKQIREQIADAAGDVATPEHPNPLVRFIRRFQ